MDKPLTDYVQVGGYTGNAVLANTVSPGKFSVAIRQPHDIHLTMLARLGIIGFLLWAFINVRIIYLFIRSLWNDPKEPFEHALKFWLFLFYITGIILASLQPWLEFSYGAIPFYIVLGFSLAILTQKRKDLIEKSYVSKILLAHNYYQQPGGEDTAFESEVNLLRERGHQVVEYIEHNDLIVKMNKVSLATQTLWSRNSYQKILTLIEKEKTNIAHFHNIFPLISPAAYYACEKAGIPVIQALDNPRLLCPSANFYRDGHLCQECLGKTPPWPSIKYGCYRNSRLETAGVASMLTLYRWMKTWQNRVSAFLVATEFYRRKFIEGGLPAKKIVVKPHFVYPDPGARSKEQTGAYVLFIGRLDPEKGVRTMLDAWKTLLRIPLKIRGDGQLETEVNEFIHSNQPTSVELVRRLSREDLAALIKNARFLIWPSEGFYETFGYVAVECFANGVPVIASELVL